MARPIKETPILTGKDSERFNRLIKENENKRISKEEIDRINKLLAINFKKWKINCLQ